MANTTTPMSIRRTIQSSTRYLIALLWLYSLDGTTLQTVVERSVF